MFTGLIQGKGCLTQLKRQGPTIQLTCEAPSYVLEGYQIGDSMAINGTCLTAISRTETTFTVDIMPETFQRTTFSLLKIGSQVNLERAMQQTQRFEGHFVAGHIDTTARLIQKRTLANALVLTFAYPVSLQGEIIAQGSIAINGVSLTVTQVQAGAFSVSLIPHSKDQTMLGSLNQGDLVNLETDMIGKYVKAQNQLFQPDWKEGLL